ncbi:MAG: hypothetical protein ACREVE_09115 [Gammaproteobacteria bacterium]
MITIQCGSKVYRKDLTDTCKQQIFRYTVARGSINLDALFRHASEG